MEFWYSSILIPIIGGRRREIQFNFIMKIFLNSGYCFLRKKAWIAARNILRQGKQKRRRKRTRSVQSVSKCGTRQQRLSWLVYVCARTWGENRQGNPACPSCSGYKRSVSGGPQAPAAETTGPASWWPAGAACSWDNTYRTPECMERSDRLNRSQLLTAWLAN